MTKVLVPSPDSPEHRRTKDPEKHHGISNLDALSCAMWHSRCCERWPELLCLLPRCLCTSVLSGRGGIRPAPDAVHTISSTGDEFRHLLARRSSLIIWQDLGDHCEVRLFRATEHPGLGDNVSKL